MDKNSTQQALREYASKGMPASPDLWPIIAQAIRTPGSTVEASPPQHIGPRSSVGRLHWPTTRLGWAAIVFVALLTVSTGTYAATSVINHSYGNDPAFQPIQQSGQQVDLSRTVNGRTVVLQRVYADALIIQIGYIIQGQNEESLAPTAIRLTDNQGNLFHPLLGVQDIRASDPSGYALSFDNATLGKEVIGKPLHLSLSLVQSKPGGTPVPMMAPVGPDAKGGAQSLAVPGAIAGPFEFDFTIAK